VNTLPSPTGGTKNTVIAVVVPYDAPNAANDLANFRTVFGLPAPNFSKEYAVGTKPSYNKQWELEASLDIEWAFAMAPNANILLVEAASNQAQDLEVAVEYAANRVSQRGGGQVVMSWIFDPPPSAADIAKFETIFTKNRSPGGVVFFAASGDSPGVYYPSMSANVVAVGGTSINRDINGTFLGESPWSVGGAGMSPSVMRPIFQNVIMSQVNAQRGVVDIAAVADAKMGGVYFYDANNDLSNQGWAGGGGTSVATAIIAGIANNANHAAHTDQDELTLIYNSVQANSIDPNNFTDIVANAKLSSQGCGTGGTQYKASLGWDFCTGAGTPNGLGGL
jgi:subtilase family serine protease